MEYVVGIDIGGIAIKYAIFDSTGTIYHNGSIETSKKGNEIVKDVISIIRKYQESYKIDGVGISVPGTPDEDGNMILGGAITDFYNYPLQNKLEEKIDMLFSIENDANCAALAEQWVGSGKTLKNYLCITFGTGVGGALILNNTLYRGFQNMAGEFGLMLVHTESKEEDLIYSSLNYYGSIPYGLMRLYKNYAHKEAANGIEVYALRNQHDPAAEKAVQEYVHTICIGLLNLSGILNPQAIMLGGSISQNTLFVKDIQDEFSNIWEKHSHLRMRTPPDILACTNHALAGCYGAAYKILGKLHMEHAHTK